MHYWQTLCKGFIKALDQKTFAGVTSEVSEVRLYFLAPPTPTFVAMQLTLDLVLAVRRIAIARIGSGSDRREVCSLVCQSSLLRLRARERTQQLAIARAQLLVATARLADNWRHAHLKPALAVNFQVLPLRAPWGVSYRSHSSTPVPRLGLRCYCWLRSRWTSKYILVCPALLSRTTGPLLAQISKRVRMSLCLDALSLATAGGQVVTTTLQRYCWSLLSAGSVQ